MLRRSALVFCLTALALTGCSRPGVGEGGSSDGVTEISSGRPGVPPIRVEVLKSGTGRQAKMGDVVQMHYTGSFPDGRVFDSSRRGGRPFGFTAGNGQVIPGWNLISLEMKQGDRWKCTIPPQLGYGAGGSPPVIPPNATLVFDMELVSVQAR